MQEQMQDNTRNQGFGESKPMQELESSTKAINQDSIKLESKNNIESKKLDSNDEIVFEVRNKYYTCNTLTHIFMFLLNMILLLCCIESSESIQIFVWLMLLIFLIYSLYLNTTILFNQVHFYITDKGVGFRRRLLCVKQEKFFEFGEVEIHIGEYSVFVLANHIEIFIAPLHLKGWNRRINIHRLHFLNHRLADDENVCKAWKFIRQKTKESLEAKGININTLSYSFNEKFICFTKENQ